MLTDPEDCQYIASTLMEKDVVYEVAKPWLGQGLVTASSHVWRRHRKLVNPAFSQPVLDGYLSVFNEQSRRLVQALAAKSDTGCFDHAHYMDATALDVICLTAMGFDDKDDVLQNSTYNTAVNKIHNTFVLRIQSTWMQNEFLYYWTALKKRQDRLIEVLHSTSNTMIQRRKSVLMSNENLEKPPQKIEKRFRSFLDILIESSADGSLSDTEIREEVDTMVSAGFETSATLLTFALVVIGSYPEVQEKMYQELEEVFEGSDRDVHKYDLPKLVYMDAVLKETMRLYPVIPIIARYVDRDIQIKNYTLKAGTSCFLHIYGVHRHPVWGPDAHEFRPERWLCTDDLSKSANTFASFGLGKRACIGQKFALTSAKTTLSYILRNYKITGDHTNMTLRMDIILKPVSGHHISIERRERKRY
ncbi:cytochrome P450 4C1-like [Pectinophora gossypiella]|uniref:cytochrome P450 4C1-like n=1 Tax=Pectinophora gossypiella TaxID=13191 RepID=UPI00214EC59C|nr:cytochrome P450 4C1-like [Pectinophora gossypiella]